MPNSNDSIGDTIVCFHIGRGGRNWNSGHLSYKGQRKIGEFIDDLFLNYENTSDFKDRAGFYYTNALPYTITSLIESADWELLEEKFGITEQIVESGVDLTKRFGFDSYDQNQTCITDLATERGNLSELQEKFGITEEMLGEFGYESGGGYVVGLSYEEAETGCGSINIDNDYNTTYCQHLNECNEEELELILAESGADAPSQEMRYYICDQLGIDEDDEDDEL